MFGLKIDYRGLGVAVVLLVLALAWQTSWGWLVPGVVATLGAIVFNFVADKGSRVEAGCFGICAAIIGIIISGALYVWFH